MMTFGSRRQAGGTSATATRKIVAWIKASILAYHIEDDTIQIMVTELECNDPDCVPLETLVALLGRDARWTHKILKPLDEVTAEDTQNLPFPASWSSWISEQHFRATLPKVSSWMNDAVQEFEELISDLSRRDKVQALNIMDRLLSDMRGKITAEIDENAIDCAKLPLDDRPFAVDASAGSTIVSMRPKTPVEYKKSLGYFGTSESSKVLTNSQNPQQSINLLHCEEIPSARMQDQKADESEKAETPATSPGVGHPYDVTSRSSRMTEISNTTDESTTNLVQINKGGSDSRASLLVSSANGSVGPAKRHKKGTRPRGCPCCDPDNIDNMIDKMIFLETPP